MTRRPDPLETRARKLALPAVIGQHDEATVAQMRNCMAIGNAVAGVICADGQVLHTLRPFAVAMAGEGEFDPWKD